jgi:hypothetical protein
MILQYKKAERKYKVEVVHSAIKASPELREEKAKLFKELNELKSVKNLSQREQKTLGKIISDYKLQLNADRFKALYLLTISIGKNQLEYTLSCAPNTVTIKSGIDELISLMKEKRADRAELKTEEKCFAGINYDTIGGVFVKKNSIVSMFQNIDFNDRIESEKKPHPSIKEHHVGIEIEMNMNVSRGDLNQLFIQNKLSGHVKNKTDGSIEHKVGEIPIEVTALFKQSKTNEIVKSICNVIKLAGGKVNNSCGLHVHLDMRNRDATVGYNNLYMCLPIINAIVPPNRTKGNWSQRYCAQNVKHILDEQLSQGGRYWAINAQSIREHKTLEVRIHSGTVNATKIINFVKLLTMIVDHGKLDARIDTMADFRTIFPEMSAELFDYLIKREDTMKSKIIDTVTDIATDAEYIEVAA